MALFTVMWFSIAANAACNFSRLLAWERRPRAMSYNHRRFKHIVVVPCYIDPVEVLFDALGSLLMQNDPQKMIVVVAFEKKTPELDIKIRTVQKAFGGLFGELIISVHTIAWATEIPGGCSNKNFALRTAHQHVSAHEDFLFTSYTITTCDTDSLFSPNYFTALEEHYNKENPALICEGTPVKFCVWQAPLFYNWDLDQRPFFNRVTGIMRSLMMLGGLISFNLNPMSIFSYPLELGLEAGFINPRYSVDDIIFLVRMMCNGNRTIPVLLLPVPCVSGPTIGTTYWEEIDEWARQIRRWIIGSSESFHYFITHFRGRPFFGGLWWFFCFFMYYAVLLCTAGVFGMSASIPLPWIEYPSIFWKYAGLAMLGAQYIVFGVAFCIDYKAVKLMTIKEDIHPLRNFFHLLSAPIVLLVYNLIALYAVLKFFFRGKNDAGHVMAAKAGLGSTTTDSAADPTTSRVEEGVSLADAEAPPMPFRSGPLDRHPTTSFSRTTACGKAKQQRPNSFCTSEAISRPRNWSQDEVRQTQSFPLAGGPAPARTGLALSESSAGIQLEPPSPQDSIHEEEVLCELPPLFYFGQFEFDPRGLPWRGGTTHVYGY